MFQTPSEGMSFIESQDPIQVTCGEITQMTVPSWLGCRRAIKPVYEIEGLSCRECCKRIRCACFSRNLEPSDRCGNATRRAHFRGVPGESAINSAGSGYCSHSQF